ncbi:MAG TPA: hypothetical protein VH500_08930 [Nitrososphaeraceae archaeon]
MVERRIEHGVYTVLTGNMKWDKDDDSLSPEVECDSNDICDDSSPLQNVRVYLVDRGIQDGHIARNICKF